MRHVHAPHIRRLAGALAVASLVLVATVSTEAQASGTAAVLAFEVDGQSPSPKVLELLVAALEADGTTFVTQPGDARNLLGIRTAVAGDDTSREVQSLSQTGVDAYFEGDVAEAEAKLLEAVALGSAQPLFFNLDPSRGEAVRQALMTLPRVVAQSGGWDAAREISRETVDMFPTYVPSESRHPPEVLSRLEDARSQLVSEGRRLTLRQTAPGDACLVRIQGVDTLLQGSREVYVAARDYAISAKCQEDGEFVGPWLVNTSREAQAFPVSRSILETLAPTLTYDTPRLPENRVDRGHVGTLLTTLLDVDRVYMVARGEGEDLLVVEVTRDGTTTQAMTSTEATSSVATTLVNALERREPVADIAIDTGTGFERAEGPSYLGEIITVSAGGALLVGGAVFLAIASGQRTVLDECGEPGRCRESTTAENNELLATDLFVGQLLVGIGGAVVVAGGTIWLTRYLLERERSTTLGVIDDIQVVAGPDGALATWRMTW